MESDTGMSLAGPADDITLPPVDEQRTSEWIVVLSAAFLHYRLSFEAGQWLIHVPVTEFERAEREIAAFEKDRQAWEIDRGPSQFWMLEGESSLSPVWVAGMLIAFYAWVGAYSGANRLAHAAAMNTELFFAGEWWRAVTALTVHSGPGHLAGNVVSISLFGYAVCRVFGAGLGWILILISGIAGNTIAASVHGPYHVSVGASTACFGALGILSGCQAIRNLRQFGLRVHLRNRSWIPIGAGLALLTLLGMGERSDLFAHLFGFLCGGVLCAPFIRREPPRLSSGRQQALQMLALAIVMLSWRLVLMAARTV